MKASEEPTEERSAKKKKKNKKKKKKKYSWIGGLTVLHSRNLIINLDAALHIYMFGLQVC